MKIGVQMDIDICRSSCKYKTKIQDFLAKAEFLPVFESFLGTLVC